MLGLASYELLGIQGAILQMVSHGLISGGLFLMVGMIYERCHSRDLGDYGGLAKLLPAYAVFFMLLTLASVGLPSTSGFAGEFLVLLGAFQAGWAELPRTAWTLGMAATAVLGVILGALYMLRLALRFLFGPPRAPGGETLVDLSVRELAMLAVLTVAIFALGLFPGSFLERTEASTLAIQALLLPALAEGGGP
jgi:NADH-quinone oxidoreductase subunit M